MFAHWHWLMEPTLAFRCIVRLRVTCTYTSSVYQLQSCQLGRHLSLPVCSVYKSLSLLMLTCACAQLGISNGLLSIVRQKTLQPSYNLHRCNQLTILQLDDISAAELKGPNLQPNGCTHGGAGSLAHQDVMDDDLDFASACHVHYTWQSRPAINKLTSQLY